MLTFGLVILCIILILTRNNNKTVIDSALRQRDKVWVRYILSFKKAANSSAEKKLIQKIISDLIAQSFINADDLNEFSDNYDNETQSIQTSVTQVVGSESSSLSSIDSEYLSDKSTNTQTSSLNSFNNNTREVEHIEKTSHLDSVSILLYFGAFLFVAAMGLFVVYSGVSGWVRTIIVLVTALAFYIFGSWIYKTRPVLQVAGLSYVGIGVAIMPLVGVAAFNFIEGVNANIVWFATSLLCLALYAHALVSVRKPLLSYIFIFTILSTFESSIAVLSMPAYYFGWIMIGTGLMLQAISEWKNIWPDFKEYSKQGSHIYVPLAMIVSLFVLPSQGFWQLGVTLLLGALFYGLESWRSITDYEYRKLTALITHLSLLAGITSLIYGINHNITTTGLSLVGLSIGHIFIIAKWQNGSELIKNIATIMLASCVLGLMMLTGHYMSMVFVLAIIVIESLFVWWWQKRDDAYVLAVVSWVVMPILFGTLAVKPSLSTNNLVFLNLAFLTFHVGFFSLVSHFMQNISNKGTSRLAILFQIIVVSIVACLTTPGITLIALSGISLILLYLSFIDKSSKNYWEITSGLVITLSVLRSWNDPVLLIAIIMALALNIILALRFKSEVNRWLSTAMWLILPVGLGGLTTMNIWSPTIYAWAYLMVMSGLIISRAIARGVVFASGNIPLASYAKTSSLSYVFGYVLAGVVALITSLFSNQSQIVTTVILVLLCLVVMILAWKIEKDSDINSLQPILFQMVLLSVLRPPTSGNLLLIFAIASTVLATSCYLTVRTSSDENSKNIINGDHFKQISIATTLIAPFLAMYATDVNWTMPIGLAITGVLLFDYERNSLQRYKEISIGVTVVAFMWFLYLQGVHNIQVYTHISAIMFAGFAWWRYQLKNGEQSNNYIYLALAVSTIPLVWQAIASDAGGVYGWWLLLEQVMFMIIGSVIHKRFVVLWGLYVATGSVIYQLRNLSYFAMIALAVFINGIAIYKLLKSSSTNNAKKPEDKNTDIDQNIN